MKKGEGLHFAAMELRKRSSYLESWDDHSIPILEGTATITTADEKRCIDSITTDDKILVGEGLGKAKVMASNGMKRVKESTSLGLHWIKDKYHKITYLEELKGLRLII